MKDQCVLIALPPYGIDLAKETPFFRLVSAPWDIMETACRLKKRVPEINISYIDFGLKDYSRYTTLEKYRHYIRTTLTQYDADADFFYISLNHTPSYGFFKLVVEFIRELYPSSTIICGGAHATATAGYYLRDGTGCPPVDFVICGEVDDALGELVAALRAGDKPDIKGVYGRMAAEAGIGASLESTIPVTDLDVDFQLRSDLFNLAAYTSHGRAPREKETRSFVVYGSRGCPGRCHFCGLFLFHGPGPRWRTVENIRDELLWLHERYGVTRFDFYDDNFVPKNKTLEFLAMLRDLQIPGMEVQLQNMSVKHLDFDIIDAMIDARVGEFTVAIESGVERVLKLMNKDCDLEKARKLVRYAREKGLYARCYYLFGTPGETLAEMRQTIEFAKTMNANWSSFGLAYPIPGTVMHQQFTQMGCIVDGPENWVLGSGFSHRYFDTPEASAKQLNWLMTYANLDANFLHNQQIVAGHYVAAEAFFTNFLSRVPHHLFACDCLRRIYRATEDKSRENAIREKMFDLARHNANARWYRPYFELLEETFHDELAAAFDEGVNR